jgi:sugar lactone lactonase YvrE
LAVQASGGRHVGAPADEFDDLVAVHVPPLQESRAPVGIPSERPAERRHRDERLPSAGVAIWCPGHCRRVIPLLADPAQVRPARHAVGPVWDDAAGELLWADAAGQVRWGRVDPAGRVSDLAVRPVGESVGAVARALPSGWLLAAGSGFRGLDLDGQVTVLLDHTGEAGTETPRSGACDRAGRFFAGTGGRQEALGAGSLYRVDLDGTVVAALTGLAVAAGIAWSPDDDVLYLADSGVGTVTAFDYDLDLGTLGRPRVLLEFGGSESGTPHGLAVDLAGHLWVALWGAGEVRRYSPTGMLETVVRVHATRVTGCAFAGSALDVLVASTAAEGLSVREQAIQPDAGRLFTARVPEVRGRSAFPYRGPMRGLTRV